MVLELSKFLSKQFSILGFRIGNHPKIFIVIPVLATLVFSIGFFWLNINSDIEIIAIKNGISKSDRQFLNHHFPLNYSENFHPSRLVFAGRYARLIIRVKDGNSIINEKSWSEIEELDNILRGVSIESNGEHLNYSQLCAAWNGDCFYNQHLGLGNIIHKIEDGSLRLSYPIMFNPVSFETYFLDYSFGGINFRKNSTNTVDTIQATRLHYFLRVDTRDENIRGMKWELAVIERLQGLDDHWQHINVYYDTYTTLKSEPDNNLIRTMPYFMISVILMSMFIIATSITSSWATSKPVVAIMGVVSANMGTLASVGALCLLGVDFISMNLAIPFIALGVGIDDTFVMLAAWWKTSPDDSVPQRMAQCYSEAAVSITITTLTDALTFYVGFLSPILVVQIFCVYAGTAVLFTYIWHVFFFGGVMALSGYHEKEGRHGLFVWRRVMLASEAEHLSGISRWFLTDGKELSNISSDKNQVKLKANKGMDFFKISFAPWLEKRYTQAAIIFIFALYLAVSIWGISQMQEGMKLHNFANSDSYMQKFYDNFERFFSEYPYRTQVVVAGELDYSTKETQDRIQDLIGNFSNLRHTTSKYGENWLTDYLKFLDDYKEFYDFNVTTEKDFIDTLRTYFLTDNRAVSQDVKFNEDFTKITASRYIVQTYNGSDVTALTEHIVDVRKMSEIPDLKVTAYEPTFILAESSVILKEMTMKLIMIAGAIVMVVSVLFIPSVIVSVFVFLSIAAVELGVLGFLFFCNINLDFISVLTLMMCVGFSVDFPAHVCYAYISSKYDTVEERLRDTLHSLGLPILQAAVSTILAMVGLFLTTSYTSAVFYKIVSLIMIFSVFNALFVLPTIILIIRPKPNSIFSQTKTYIVNK